MDYKIGNNEYKIGGNGLQNGLLCTFFLSILLHTASVHIDELLGNSFDAVIANICFPPS